MNRRLIGLFVAVVLAGVATFFLWQYLTTADERAREAETLVEVFVAQGDIEAGTVAGDAIGQGLITRDEIPARAVPEGAIGDLEIISGQVAVGPIYDGEVIVAQRFGTTVAQPTGLFEVPEGFQAVTIEAGVVPGLAGYVQPQDMVSVVASLNLPAEDDEEGPPPDIEDEDAELDADEGLTPGQTVPGGFTTQYLVHNAVVLSVGQRVVSTEDGEQTPSIQLSNERYLFTLAMTPEDIEKLVFSTQQGDLWFTLLPPLEEGEEPVEVETPGRTIENVFDD